MRSTLLLSMALFGCVLPRPVPSAQSATAGEYALVNGRWFDGSGFRSGSMYVVDGHFTDREPARVDSVIDLRGGYVIPPFGDAHTHNLDGAQNLAAVRDAYLREGTFYVQVLTNSRQRAARVRDRFNRPGELDVLYANGGVTSTLSHPFQAYEPFAMGIYDPRQWSARAAEISASRLLENDAYWFVDSAADLAAKWPQILDGRPDLIKVFLLDARGETTRQADPWGGPGPGLDPALVPDIVKRAHEAGLRVAAHVETAADAAIAISAGVDILAHLPGYSVRAGEPLEPYVIPDELARHAGRSGVVVMANALLVNVYARGDSTQLARAQALQRSNLERLRRHGVEFIVGSDAFGRTALPEFYALRDLGIWDHRELIMMWSEATPRSMFPGRRIGRLLPGYEASLLVLDCNPIERLECVEDIRLRMKQGVVVALPKAVAR